MGKTMIEYLMFYAIVISGLISTTQCANPSFKENAADFLEAGFKKTTRRGVERKDYTKLEIEARPLLMVQNSSSIDKNRVTIEIKSGDADWKAITTLPSMRGGVYKWTESNVLPCVNHNVRIWMHGLDESQNSFDYPDTIAAASLDDISASGYRPHKPEDVQIGKYSEGILEVNWTPSKCAIMYDVTYQKVTGGKTVSKQVQSSQGNSIILTEELDSCSEYEIKVSAVIGDEYSEENIVTFSTPPEINAAERLEPITKSTLNSVIVKWKGFEKLSCISEYLVSICKEGEECSAGQKVERDDSLQFMKYKSDLNLEECSEYSLNIKPIHEEVDLKGKNIKFRTHSHPIDNVASLLTPVQAEADDEQMITVKWNAIKCANHYEVFQKVNTPDGEWERIGTTVDNFFKQKGVPCTEYKYGVKVTVNDQESDIVEFDKAITVPPVLGISEEPTLVINEKTNNSLTFVINNHKKNHRCKVEQYHVKYSTEEEFIDPKALEDGKMTIIVPIENTKIEGRIKYQGFDSWSPWVSSDAPLKEKQIGEEIGLLLPIIIGSVIAVAVVALIIFLVVRNRSSQVKYDAEKAEGNTEESKNLNKQMEEKVSSEKSS